jgi:hypothetical protein
MNRLGTIIERHTLALGFFTIYTFAWLFAITLLAYGKHYGPPDSLLVYPAFVGSIVSVPYCLSLLLAALLTTNYTRFYLKLAALAVGLPVVLLTLVTIS